MKRRSRARETSPFSFAWKVVDCFKVREPAFTTIGLTLRSESVSIGKVALQGFFAEAPYQVRSQQA